MFDDLDKEDKNVLKLLGCGVFSIFLFYLVVIAAVVGGIILILRSAGV